jgi:hypothetical protein
MNSAMGTEQAAALIPVSGLGRMKISYCLGERELSTVSGS